MAEEKQEKTEEKHQDRKSSRPALIGKESTERIIRILQTDVPGTKSVYAGITRIRGVSWAISNAVCFLSGIDKNKKIESLTKDEIHKLEETIKNGKFPNFLLNRRKDFSTGVDSHIIGSDLELVRELDVKRLKKIRSFKGLRHATGQPTRGQRTRSHFRTNRKRGVGVKNKKPANTSGGN
jgi:small subunit ribosomal protein S13